jgi:hypothetical protein
MRYRLTISPRAPRRNAGYLTGLLLLVLGMCAVLGAGILADVTTHALAAMVVAL